MPEAGHCLVTRGRLGDDSNPVVEPFPLTAAQARDPWSTTTLPRLLSQASKSCPPLSATKLQMDHFNVMRIELNCAECGSNNFTLDKDMDDRSHITCGDCRHRIGTLADLKEKVAETVRRHTL